MSSRPINLHFPCACVTELVRAKSLFGLPFRTSYSFHVIPQVAWVLTLSGCSVCGKLFRVLKGAVCGDLTLRKKYVLMSFCERCIVFVCSSAGKDGSL